MSGEPFLPPARLLERSSVRTIKSDGIELIRVPAREIRERDVAVIDAQRKARFAATEIRVERDRGDNVTLVIGRQPGQRRGREDLFRNDLSGAGRPGSDGGRIESMVDVIEALCPPSSNATTMSIELIAYRYPPPKPA